MPLIKAKEADSKIMQAEVLRLQDIEAEAARILAAARTQAESLLAQARVQAEKIKAEARKSGLDAGRLEGLATGTEAGKKQAMEQAKVDFATKHVAIVKAFTAALHEFEARRRGLLSDLERDVVALAGAIASRVVKAAVEVDPSCVAANVREALQLIVDKNGLEVRLHSVDLDQAREFAKDLLSSRDFQAIRFVPDDSVGRGGVVLRTSAGQVDASIETQCIRILDEIMAGWQEHWLLGPAVIDSRAKETTSTDARLVEVLQEAARSLDDRAPIVKQIDPADAKEAPRS